MKAFLALLILSGSHLLLADDEADEVYSCSFTAHTPSGALSGVCTTQSLPDANSISRWKLTLTFDEQSSIDAMKLKNDRFFDVVRTQCLRDGSFMTVMSLWGEVVITPNDADYAAGNRACSPRAQAVPSLVTISVTSSIPLRFEFLLDERRVDFDAALGVPTNEWVTGYVESFRRLAGNPAVYDVPRN